MKVFEYKIEAIGKSSSENQEYNKSIYLSGLCFAADEKDAELTIKDYWKNEDFIIKNITFYNVIEHSKVLSEYFLKW